ncbi:MAG: PDZ domain-containing protein [Ignavibacteriae bacterium]|nr:PDZ domain-containing protein [Ignavibacteria bacterium]MBI3365465.1 PDZ domain-containing protein [Ignavibacteriota bacterium]
MTSRILSVVFLVGVFFLACSYSRAQHVTRTYIFDHQREHGHLGVNVDDVTPKLKERKNLSVDAGAYVKDVVEDSPAEKAGVKEGDVIVKLNDRTIEDSDDLIRAIQRTKPKSDVKIEVVRSKEHKTLTATLERERAPRAFAYGFGDGDIHLPKLPRMPHSPKMPQHFEIFSSDRLGGLTVQELTKQLAEYFQVPDRRGLLVTEVEKESDAEKAGFKAGDVITKVNKNSVRDVDDLRQEMEDSDGKDLPVEVVRSGKAVSLKLHIESEDADDDDDMSFNASPDQCYPHKSCVRIRSSELKQNILDRVMESLDRIKMQIENRINSVAEQIKSTFVSLSSGGDQAAVAHS